MNTDAAKLGLAYRPLEYWIINVVMAAVHGLIKLLGRAYRLWNEDDPAPAEPAPALPGGSRNAVLVLDASPSMEAEDWKPSRLEAAKASARAYVNRLRAEEPDARVAVVAYSSSARTMCGLTPVSKVGRLLRAIDDITVGDGTNITAGLTTAGKHLQGIGRAAQVVLLTDGAHNTGPEPTPVAARLRTIAILETVGIGGQPADVNEDLLKAISSAYPDGSKRYRWIGDKETLVRHFHNLAGRITRES